MPILGNMPFMHGADIQPSYGQYGQSQTGGYGGSSLPTVTDPEQTQANITRSDYQDFITNFGKFEEDLIGKLDDTSLVDEAPEDARQQAEIQRGIQQRNIERYGTELTGVQRSEMGRASQRGEQLDVAGGTNEARIAQFEINQKMRSSLMNIASGVYGKAMQGLGNAASNAAGRRQAYSQAKANARASNISAAGSILTTAIIFGI